MNRKSSEGAGARPNRETASSLDAVQAWLSNPATEEKRTANDDRWTATLLRQAHDDSDPETRDNARAVLDARGITY